MNFTITITDPHSIAGITAARNAYNAALPTTVQPGQAPPPAPIAADADYVQFVMVMAAQSYAKQYNT